MVVRTTRPAGALRKYPLNTTGQRQTDAPSSGTAMHLPGPVALESNQSLINP